MLQKGKCKSNHMSIHCVCNVCVINHRGHIFPVVITYNWQQSNMPVSTQIQGHGGVQEGGLAQMAWALQLLEMYRSYYIKSKDSCWIIKLISSLEIIWIK